MAYSRAGDLPFSENPLQAASPLLDALSSTTLAPVSRTMSAVSFASSPSVSSSGMSKLPRPLTDVISDLQEKSFTDLYIFFDNYLKSHAASAPDTKKMPSTISYDKVFKVFTSYIQDIQDVRCRLKESDQVIAENPNQENLAAELQEEKVDLLEAKFSKIYAAWLVMISDSRTHRSAPELVLNQDESTLLINILNVFKQQHIQQARISNKLLKIKSHAFKQPTVSPYAEAEEYCDFSRAELAISTDDTISALQSQLASLNVNVAKNATVQSHAKYLAAAHEAFSKEVENSNIVCDFDRIQCEIGVLDVRLLQSNDLTDVQLDTIKKLNIRIRDVRHHDTAAVDTLVDEVDTFIAEYHASNALFRTNREKDIAARQKYERFFKKIQHDLFERTKAVETSLKDYKLSEYRNIESITHYVEFESVISCVSTIQERIAGIESLCEKLNESISAINTLLTSERLTPFQENWIEIAKTYREICTTYLIVDDTFLTRDERTIVEDLSNINDVDVTREANRAITLRSEVAMSGYDAQPLIRLHKKLLNLKKQLETSLLHWKPSIHLSAINDYLAMLQSEANQRCDETRRVQQANLSTLKTSIMQWQIKPAQVAPMGKDRLYHLVEKLQTWSINEKKRRKEAEERLLKQEAYEGRSLFAKLTPSQKSASKLGLRQSGPKLVVITPATDVGVEQPRHNIEQLRRPVLEGSILSPVLRKPQKEVKPSLYSRMVRFTKENKKALVASASIGASVGAIVGAGLGMLLAPATLGLSVPLFAALCSVGGAIIGAAALGSAFVVCQKMGLGRNSNVNLNAPLSVQNDEPRFASVKEYGSTASTLSVRERMNTSAASIQKPLSAVITKSPSELNGSDEKRLSDVIGPTTADDALAFLDGYEDFLGAVLPAASTSPSLGAHVSVTSSSSSPAMGR